ncbi:uncharacterized protein LOC128883817 [Hylaeus volcanicus]|uniref:uncharacterized protein LOC128883817 n=1 Tax=Hylaeus volcanicus TaxID=313075 RepID=UPI0023B7C8B6|nr:uncharacterized protein LOC128883817 [Hylaeus volcanicus]
MRPVLAEDKFQIASLAKMSKKKRTRTSSVVTAESVIQSNNNSLNNGIYNAPPTLKKSKKNKQNQDSRTDFELIQSIFLQKQPNSSKTTNKNLDDLSISKQIFDSPANLFVQKSNLNKILHKKENLRSKFPSRREDESLTDFHKRVDDTARQLEVSEPSLVINANRKKKLKLKRDKKKELRQNKKAESEAKENEYKLLHEKEIIQFGEVVERPPVNLKGYMQKKLNRFHEKQLLRPISSLSSVTAAKLKKKNERNALCINSRQSDNFIESKQKREIEKIDLPRSFLYNTKTGNITWAGKKHFIPQ